MIKDSIEIYKSTDGSGEIEVKLDNDTVWLTQMQMIQLFLTSKANVSEHLKHIFECGELDEQATVRNFRTVQKEGARLVKRNRAHYNLDAIISVGYRINSKRGVQFRQWATQRLKDYLVKGYAINEKRLEQKNQEVIHLKNGIKILNRVIEQEIDNSNDHGMLSLFASGLSILDDYDHENLDSKGTTKCAINYPTVAEYLDLIKTMYSDFESGVFAKPKDKSFDSSINQIRQFFGENELYPSLEEKAATLLYLIVKNHSFVDGNKRIGAACFLYFLESNNRLKNDHGELIISNEALASLTLFIATSEHDEMETVKRLTITLLNRRGN